MKVAFGVRFLCGSGLAVLGACSSRPVAKQPVAAAFSPVIQAMSPPVAADPAPAERVSPELAQTTPLNQAAAAKAALLEQDNEHVQKWLRYFTGRDKSRFQRHLDRALFHKDLVKTILKEEGVPPEIFYLGIIESGYRYHAKSSASAVGVWQFIKETGQRYGLKVNSYTDERRDPMRSTVAAARYLRDLYNVFNSWELALSAYNAGEGRILRSVMRGKTRDYWQLVEKKMLPDETANYVPKFIAAAMIAENPERFGFQDPGIRMQRPRKIVVPGGLRLKDLAENAKIDFETLRVWNPHLIRDITPPQADEYALWIPAQFERSLSSAAARTPRRPAVAVFQPRQPPAEIEETMRPRRSIPAVAVKPVARAQNQPRPPTRLVVVRAGDSLTRLADRHKTDVLSLKRLNRLSGDSIFPGMKLVVPAPPAREAVARYRVRSGDSLTAIADRFGLSIQELKRMNELSRDRVYAGEVLKVERRGI